jgi:hypothetical protein
MNFEFTDKKSVFYDKYFGIFDTPKKLNRSSKTVPQSFIDSVESGEVLSTDIKEIAKQFPIFTYKSCITIHGAIPEINRTRIGHYKNLIQNANGSMEIRWSAIDHSAKKQIKSFLNFADQWYTQENSTNGIYFEKTQKTEDKEKANEILKAERAKIELLDVPEMTAKIFVQGWAYFGRFYIITTILPYSVTGSPLDIAVKLTGAPAAHFATKQAEQQAEQAKRDAERENANAQRETAAAAAEQMVKSLPKTQLSATPGRIFVVPTIGVNNGYTPAVRFYKIESKGTFGRVTVSSYVSDSLRPEADKFQPYMKGKQLKISEITLKQVYAI